jgi:hypothetical protein
MRLLSWQVPSLQPVECYLPQQLERVAPLRHLGTAVQAEPLLDGRRTGDTAWGALLDGRLVAAAWDWVEVLPGVVSLADPDNVLTNLRFLDAGGCYEEPTRAVISINRLIHQTPWQTAVCAALRGAALPAAGARPPERFARAA